MNSVNFLPQTRFNTRSSNVLLEPLQEIKMEKEKEREVIQGQPYRTTQLVFPNPKPKPELVKNKFSHKRMTTSLRPNIDQRNVVANLNDSLALVQRQTYNNPRPLYSDQNYKEAIYVQTGLNVNNPQYQSKPSPASSSQIGQPIHRTPDQMPQFKPQSSPTYRAILEEEGPGTPMPAPNIHQQAPPQQHQQSSGGGPASQRNPRYTAPTYHLNSVGQPTDRIAQSHSFRRLMLSVMGEM